MNIHALAAQGQQDRLLELLSSRSVDVNQRDNDQRTAMHWAAFTGKTDAALVLVRFGADVNALDSRSVSPLMVAALNSHLHVAQILLQHGARTDIRSLQGRTAESVATMPELIALIRRTANSNNPIANASVSSSPAANSPKPPPKNSNSAAGVGVPVISNLNNSSNANNVVRPRPAVSMASSPTATAPPPAVPVRKGSVGPQAVAVSSAMLISPMVANVANVSTSLSSTSSSPVSASSVGGGTDDDRAIMRMQIADLSDRLAKANAQIASLLERLAVERTANARLHDRLREMQAAGGVMSISPRENQPTGSSPPKLVGSPPAVLPRARAIPRVRSTSPPAPGARAVPTDRSSPPTPTRGQPNQARTDLPPPARGSLVQPSVPMRSSAGFADPPLRGSSGVFETLMDAEERNTVPADTSQYGSISKALAVEYGAVPLGGTGAGLMPGLAYGSLPLAAQAQGEGNYIGAHEQFEW